MLTMRCLPLIVKKLVSFRVHNINFLKGVAFMQTSKLLPHDTVMLLQPQLVKQFGRAGALLLSQLHYWLNKKNSLGCNHQGNRWIYNTAEEWAEQLQLSARYVRQLFAKMADLGIVKIEKLHKIKSVRTNYYSIDYDQLHKFVGTEDSFANLSAEIITGPLGKNNLIYNDTKITNKDTNKSEDFEKNSKMIGQGGSKTKQVKQVKNLNLKNEKKLDALQEFATTCLAIEKNKRADEANPSMPKTTTAQDMLKVWNDIFAAKSEAKLTKELAPLLVSAFKNKFESNLKNWQNYCDQLKSSSYLMGGSFNLTLGWALRFATIDRIRAGELGVKISPRDTSTGQGAVIDEAQIIQMIKALPDSAISKALRHKISKAIGYAAYYSWFHAAKFCEEGGEIRMVAPNAFVEQYWETNFDWVLGGVEQ